MTEFRLVYYSRNLIQEDTLAQAVDTILQASRRNNHLVGVTGALMFSRGHFAQVLEGDQAAIESTFERIQQDTRHGEVHLLDFSPAPERQFRNWSMAFVGLGDDPSFGAAARSGFDPRTLDGQQLFDRLLDLLNE
ncbi:MAG: BLUF domain-containing protein [Candidatus Devosia phytovorans]|uniref:BLUF domain-containing protein n=1 Tax=Candidatus Devosia phytovorans TaxID=3121372 RepID=A0AAJ6AY65_9HYPH|nr:BLUF domain-containing protein [Devosia sp.]WEK03230.1 MAG: BLUF domain-containing protein [Devosia sp.]